MTRRSSALFPTAFPVAGIAMLAILLSACIFDKGDGTFTYTTELNDLTRIVYAYNADGSVQSNLGVGIETVGSGVFLAPGTGSEDASDATPMVLLWPVDDEVMVHSAPHLVGIGRDSTYDFEVIAGILLPQFALRKAHAGFPCSFSRPRAYQVAANGDTIAIRTRGTHVDRADSVRFAVLLDEAALAANARFDSREPVTATVRLTCPNP